MKLPKWTRHVTTRAALDYLEGRAGAAEMRALEEHVAGPCPDCRDRLQKLGRMLDVIRAERAPQVSEALRRRALELFGPRPAPQPALEPGWLTARLLFDSLGAALPATVRRSVGDARALRFALGEHALEIEAELEEPETLTLRGRLQARDPGEFRLEIVAGGERFTARIDASGGFAIRRVPPGVVRITVTGPGGSYRLPEFML